VSDAENPQISPLRCPGFPVEVGGVGKHHAPFLKRKAHTRSCPSAAWQEIRVRSVEEHFHERSAELQIPRLRSG